MASRRSARLFHQEGLRLTNTPGNTTLECLPIEIFLLIAEMMVYDAETSAQPLTWNATYDSRDKRPKLELNRRQRRLALLRFRMIRDVSQINKLFRHVVLKVFRPDFEVFHRGRAIALAVVLLDIDAFASCHAVIYQRSRLGVASFIAQLTELQPEFQNIHLRMRPHSFVYAFTGGHGSRYCNPMAELLALKDITLDEDCRTPESLRLNRLYRMLNPIPRNAKRLQVMEKSLGPQFYTLWMPYFNPRGVRMFVNFCDTPKTQFELVSTLRGLRIRGV
ncbi:uncharacterized protein CLUP02_13224 [Colletotrichum lupini]|uniref:Uncharacterized protein n=1 Tax=Colletotrichum lupini TaxID=145971 RepID=A0A9Q8T2A6_9PEZI|nr:uncharacterized protein CLUP02_13224 [Colletotrichum lupini]UQC87705.1 hypothetical protein CLUP02_13224 [Colletotrichum lupini]